MTNQLRDFLEYLRLNRNASAHTSAAYESDLTQFFGFTAQSRRISVEALEPSHLDLGAIRAFMADLYRHGQAREENKATPAERPAKSGLQTSDCLQG